MHHDHRDHHGDWEHRGPRDHWDHRERDHGPTCCCGGHCGPDCGCRDGEPQFNFQRHFVSKTEMLEALEWYLSELLNEAQGVREAIADLKEEIAEEQGTPAPTPTPPAQSPRARRVKAEAPKRPRGRPRKTPAPAEEPQT